MSSRKSVAWRLGYQVSSIVLAIAQAAILSRALLPTGRGLLYFHLTLAATIPLFLVLGIPEAYLYFVKSGKFNRDEALSNLFWFSLAAGMAAASLYLGIALLYGHAVVESLGWRELLQFSLISGLILQNSLWSTALLTDQRFGYLTVAAILPTVFFLGLALPLFFLDRLTLSHVVSIILGAQLLGVAFLLAGVWPWRLLKPRLQILKTLLLFGLVPYAANLLTVLIYRVDTFFLGIQRAPADLGYYAAAQGLAEALWLLPAAVSTILLPLQTGRAENERAPLTVIVCRFQFTVALILGLILAGGSTLIIRLLYSAKFLAAVQPLLVLLPGCVLVAVSKTVAVDFGARGLYRVTFQAALASCLLNLALNYPLIRWLGITGAALSTSLAYILGICIQLAAYRRLTNYRIRDFFVPQWADFDVLLITPLRHAVKRGLTRIRQI